MNDTDEKTLTIWDLEKEVRQEVFERIADFDGDNQSEIISEIVDGAIPVYNSDLLDVAKSDLWIACEQPEIYGFNGEHTAVNAIAGVLYEHLSEVAHKEYERLSEADNE